MNTDIYTVEEIAPGTFRLDECGRDNCYLLCGEERALLIDCSLGTGDLLRAVRRLTDLPLTVAVTHTHGDHAGGGYQFGTIHVPRAETHDSFRGQNLRVFRRMLLSNRMKRQGITKKNIRGSIRKTAWLPFDDGDVFDLGGRAVRAVSVPAHTIGGTVFLDETNRLAFLGDTACPVLPMHTYRALPLSAWEAQGDRLLALTDGYALWCGHGDGRLDRALVQQQLGWVREILAAHPANEAERKAVFYPAFDPAGCVGFRPANLYETDKRKGWVKETWNSILHG
ncbi:MAG: MBL fold metallo-hydrolase [Clostridia bacterium]|nr:MBL fold metallo-hydrolase [Clostridia bacterium]